jgi:hypothetical protein
VKGVATRKTTIRWEQRDMQFRGHRSGRAFNGIHDSILEDTSRFGELELLLCEMEGLWLCPSIVLRAGEEGTSSGRHQDTHKESIEDMESE